MKNTSKRNLNIIIQTNKFLKKNFDSCENTTINYRSNHMQGWKAKKLCDKI